MPTRLDGIPPERKQSMKIPEPMTTPRTTASAAVLFVAFCILQVSAAELATAQTPVDEDGRLVQFERDIAPILKANCLECHGPDDAKNDFRVDDISFMDYVEPDDAESSSVFTDYLITEDEEMLMPPTSHGGPLSPAELAMIRVWINEGADWPEDFQMTAESEQPIAAPAADEKPAGLISRVWSFQGYLHPATVHFPIALLLIGALFVVLGWKWPAIGTQVPLACLIIGAASAIGASAMGWSFATEQGYGGWAKIDTDSEIFWHRWSAVIVTVTSSVFAVIAIIAVSKQKSELNKIWKTGLLVVAGMVGAVGHQGGELTYGHDFYPKAFRILLGESDAPPQTEAATNETDATDAEQDDTTEDA